jgi:dTDP-glucose 4,6-dehydratase
VYGDPLIHPQPETYWGNVNPIGPARRLRRGEAIRRGADDGVSSARTASTRASCGSSTRTASGCGRATAAVVPALICQALAGEPMTVFGDGKQTRSFCYVSDLIDGIYRLPAVRT